MGYTLGSGIINELVINGYETRSTQVIENILHFVCPDPDFDFDAPITSATSVLLLSSFADAWRLVISQLSTHYKVSTYVLREIVGTEIVGGHHRLKYRGLDTKIADPALDIGGISGETCPATDAISVRKATNKSGRNYRGSMRVGPLREASQSNGALTASYRGVMQAEFDAFFAGLDTGGSRPNADAQFVVFARTLALLQPPGNFNEATTLTLWAPITAMPVNPNVGTQKSRKAKQTILIDQSA